MFVGKVRLKFLLIPFVGAIALLFLVYVTAPLLPKIGRIQTVRARIERYIHKDSNQQTNEGLSQSDYGKLAIYEGGTIGKGPGGSQVRNYMAAAYNDFIYAIFIVIIFDISVSGRNYSKAMYPNVSRISCRRIDWSDCLTGNDQYGCCSGGLA
jgi:hypothetical protein